MLQCTTVPNSDLTGTNLGELNKAYMVIELFFLDIFSRMCGGGPFQRRMLFERLSKEKDGELVRYRYR
jgi:hypothetical protein